MLPRPNVILMRILQIQQNTMRLEMNASYMRIPKKLELIKYEIFEDSNEYSKTRIQMDLRILINIIVILWPIKIWLWQIGVSLHLHFAINLEKFIILNTTQKILLFGNNINMNLSIINIFMLRSHNRYQGMFIFN